MSLPEIVILALNAVNVGRYSITAAYTVLFYDWIISLDEEVNLIYPASWNVVKIAYIFCRYYPLLVSPFHFWGFVVDHKKSVCQSHYHALYACAMPTVLSAQFILMLRSYAFSGRRRLVLVVLSTVFFSLVGVVVWVIGKQLYLTSLFVIRERNGCFATSNPPLFGRSPTIGAYQLGLISLLTALFDCLNVFVVIRHCVRERSTLGPLGQSFLKQGVLVYVTMTALNALTIGTYFTSNLIHQGVGSWFAYILPSALSCRLVLILRRKVRPTPTELDIQYSNMINEALEMIAVQPIPRDTKESFIPFEHDDAQALEAHGL
ncbi:hypothetical protein BJV78DRAFT_347277 [Lactifluus subvellereus]|nr:hypothetical protein BJV78DRAFT_347277 [Lactifluus subvellereus]